MCDVCIRNQTIAYGVLVCSCVCLVVAIRVASVKLINCSDKRTTKGMLARRLIEITCFRVDTTTRMRKDFILNILLVFRCTFESRNPENIENTHNFVGLYIYVLVVDRKYDLKEKDKLPVNTTPPSPLPHLWSSPHTLHKAECDTCARTRRQFSYKVRAHQLAHRQNYNQTETPCRHSDNGDGDGDVVLPPHVLDIHISEHIFCIRARRVCEWVCACTIAY